MSRVWTTATGRVEAFSDGVFAIATTLLVLDLRPPEAAGEFGRELLAEWPSYLAYLAAFVMIGSVWLHHHVVFSLVRQVDLRLILVNTVVLLLASVLPFPTAVVASAWRLGEQSDRSVALALFALISLALSASYGWLCTTLRSRPNLLRDIASTAFLAGERRRVLVAVVALVITIAVGLIAPLAGLVLVAATPVFYLATLSTRTLPASVEGRGE